MSRLPVDTWTMARVPAGVRLEMVGDATEVEIRYRTEHPTTGYLGGDEGATFSLWRGDELVSDVNAEVGEATVRLPFGIGDDPAVVHLPERMSPTVLEVTALEGSIEPAPRGPRWLCYGDSIAEGWVVTNPGRAWPAVAGRLQGLDAVNLGYAGSCRGEIASAEELAELDADVITLSQGTNCWTRTPHSAAHFGEKLTSFIEIVRQGHEQTPIVAVSPIIRPDAEDTPNRLGTTLVDLRRTFEEVVGERIASGDTALSLIEGGPIVTEDQLADGIHPGDEGHRALAEVIGPAVAVRAGEA
jgi:lysophospholipase L1-like esterase